MEDRVKPWLLLFAALVACGKEPTRAAELPDELVRVDSLEPPPGIDTSPLPDGAWIRYQEISIRPCSSAIRVRVDESGAVSSVVDRAYDCTSAIAPEYRPGRLLSPAEMRELRAAIDVSGFWKLGPAYKSADRINDGVHTRLEVRDGAHAHTIDYRQIEDARLERVLTLIRSAI